MSDSTVVSAQTAITIIYSLYTIRKDLSPSVYNMSKH